MLWMEKIKVGIFTMISEIGMMESNTYTIYARREDGALFFFKFVP